MIVDWGWRMTAGAMKARRLLSSVEELPSLGDLRAAVMSSDGRPRGDPSLAERGVSAAR